MRFSRPPLLIPLGLVALGVVLLLGNFRLIDAGTILRFSPALLIVAGLQLLLRGDVGLTWQMQTFGITRGTVRTASLEASAGELDVKIRALRREGRLIAGQYTARSRPELETRGDHARLFMRRGAAWAFSLADWEVGLAKDLPWTLLISTHLGELDIDLANVRVNQADFATGFGDIRLILGDGIAGGVRASSTFGHITIVVPNEVEAVIRVADRPLARLQVDESRFLMVQPGLYATLGYREAEGLIYCEVGSTFGVVRVN
ncbi:MAG TPA: DUF5668 domain-containing protein [Aggregatilineales bacterium]|nr:hypothetical protein [Anaerolineales bacterium]HRE49081.1 DUF5668 domain-containing protein [Aggregatilineales bacterium]